MQSMNMCIVEKIYKLQIISLVSKLLVQNLDISRNRKKPLASHLYNNLGFCPPIHINSKVLVDFDRNKSEYFFFSCHQKNS